MMSLVVSLPGFERHTADYCMMICEEVLHVRGIQYLLLLMRLSTEFHRLKYKLGKLDDVVVWFRDFIVEISANHLVSTTRLRCDDIQVASWRVEGRLQRHGSFKMVEV